MKPGKKSNIEAVEKHEHLGDNLLQEAPVAQRYASTVRRLLYMAEFLFLLNYVEVITLLVLSIHLFAAFHMPNRDYYNSFHGMDQDQFMRTLQNVVFYCFLQIVSLVLLIYTLQRMLGFSPLWQLAFVLEKQFHWVQVSLVFWLFYNVDSTLQHTGYDYTFQFEWLLNRPANGSA